MEMRVVARLGFEPRQADSESAVLPLHHRAMKLFNKPDFLKWRK